jgi:uncharacterized membrane protein YeaQ/YmgE (transglycosylase-associated protein family)
MLALVVLWLLFGAVAAALAIVTTGRDSIEDTLFSLSIGLSGAILGGLVFSRLLSPGRVAEGSLLTAFVGASFFLALSLLLSSPSRER